MFGSWTKGRPLSRNGHEKSSVPPLRLYMRRVGPLQFIAGAVFLTRAAELPLLVGHLTFSQDTALQWRISPSGFSAASDAFLRTQCPSRGVYPHFT